MLRLEFRYNDEYINDGLEKIADRGPLIVVDWGDEADNLSLYDLVDHAFKPFLRAIGFTEETVNKIQVVEEE